MYNGLRVRYFHSTKSLIPPFFRGEMRSFSLLIYVSPVTRRLLFTANYPCLRVSPLQLLGSFSIPSSTPHLQCHLHQSQQGRTQLGWWGLLRCIQDKYVRLRSNSVFFLPVGQQMAALICQIKQNVYDRLLMDSKLILYCIFYLLRCIVCVCRRRRPHPPYIAVVCAY